jgi:hypothetical protein
MRMIDLAQSGCNCFFVAYERYSETYLVYRKKAQKPEVDIGEMRRYLWGFRWTELNLAGRGVLGFRRKLLVRDMMKGGERMQTRGGNLQGFERGCALGISNSNRRQLSVTARGRQTTVKLPEPRGLSLPLIVNKSN